MCSENSSPEITAFVGIPEFLHIYFEAFQLYIAIAAVQFSLDPDDLAFLMDHLQPIASRWKPFGLQLGLLPGELDTIAATPLLTPGGPVAYLQELLSRWLNHAPPFPTLTKLCDVLRSPTVDQSRIAQALEQQYQTQKAGLSSQAVMI